MYWYFGFAFQKPPALFTMISGMSIQNSTFLKDLNKVTVLHLWFSFIKYGLRLFLFPYKMYSQNDIFKNISRLFILVDTTIVNANLSLTMQYEFQVIWSTFALVSGSNESKVDFGLKKCYHGDVLQSQKFTNCIFPPGTNRVKIKVLWKVKLIWTYFLS